MQVNFFVGAFHDAVWLYGYALNETLEAGRDPRDGYNVTRTMWDRHFFGRLSISNSPTRYNYVTTVK